MAMLVVTETSTTYVVDPTARTVTRVPGNGADPDPDAEPVELRTAVLRRDAEVLPLLRLEPVCVGEPMVMWLDVRGDGVPTLRTTTLVRRVVHLD